MYLLNSRVLLSVHWIWSGMLYCKHSRQPALYFYCDYRLFEHGSFPKSTGFLWAKFGQYEVHGIKPLPWVQWFNIPVLLSVWWVWSEVLYRKLCKHSHHLIEIGVGGRRLFFEISKMNQICSIHNTYLSRFEMGFWYFLNQPDYHLNILGAQGRFKCFQYIFWSLSSNKKYFEICIHVTVNFKDNFICDLKGILNPFGRWDTSLNQTYHWAEECQTRSPCFCLRVL